jgi:hypothetical protein
VCPSARPGPSPRPHREPTAASGIAVIRTPARTPRAHAVCERFLGSVRRECVDHRLVLGERHPRRVLAAYVAYFNGSRPHRGIGQCPPLDASTGRVPDAGDEIPCEAYAVRGRGEVALGVITVEEHRGQGYATLTGAQLAAACEARGWPTAWGCRRAQRRVGRHRPPAGQQTERACTLVRSTRAQAEGRQRRPEAAGPRPGSLRRAAAART